MLRVTVQWLLATALLAIAVSCGGGGGPDIERVPIQPIDFAGVELSVADLFSPPSVDAYPAVVAEVNGEPITRESLATSQVMQELSRRQRLDDLPEAFAESLFAPQLAELEATDPLEPLIDNVLERQAVERLGLLPSYDEAVELTRAQQELMIAVAGQATAEDAALYKEQLRPAGYPESDWASDATIVERFRLVSGLGALRSSECTRVTPAIDGLNLVSGGQDCSEFLRHERKAADIVYFVEWAE